jgi:hypothetical protein
MPKIIKKYGKTALVLALILVLVAIYGLIPLARAASLTKERDTLSDSRPSTIAKHTVIFQATTAVPLSGHVIVDLPDGFITPAGDYTDVAIYFDANDPPTTECLMAAACDGTHCCVTITPATDLINITLKSGAGITAGHYVKVVIGDGVAASGWEDITNPTVGVYDVDITTQNAAAGGLDTGKAKVAIVAGVEVTATVAETLSFTITNVAAASCPETIGGTDKSDDASHDADTVSFGTLTPETFYFSCQSLAIVTNAPTGYTCTVQETDQLKTAGATEFPDGDCNNGTCTETGVGLWTTTTEGGFGYCMDDVTGNGALTTDASDDAGTGATDWLVANQCDDATPNFKIFAEKAIDSPDTEAVMKSYTPASDTTYMGYKINALYAQAAGDYSTTTIFVATPTY